MKKIVALILTMLAIAGFSTAASAAMSIEIDFWGGTTGLLQGDYDTGDTITLNYDNSDWVMVDIVASGVEDTNGVALTSWILTFNPATMQVSMLNGGPDFFGTVIREIDNVKGTVKIESLATTPISGEVNLGSFRIDCTAIGLDGLLIAELNANNNLLGDGTDYSNLYPLDAIATVNQVPIPAAAWLLGSGLLGLVAIRRKRKS